MGSVFALFAFLVVLKPFCPRCIKRPANIRKHDPTAWQKNKTEASLIGQ